MYTYFIALGSNIGNVYKNIDTAIAKLQENACIVLNVAPFYLTEPLLPNNATANYKKTFCNTVIQIKTQLSPYKLLNVAKKIETAMGRPILHPKWSPRIIDIDILYCKKEDEIIHVNNDILTIPHPEILNRSFVLDPLSQIAPNLQIKQRDILSCAKQTKNHQAVKMAIINVNHNSFSGDGLTNSSEIDSKIKSLIKKRVAFIDIGAESTKPNVLPISTEEEIKRLNDACIFNLVQKYQTNGIKFSIDTYHPETAEMAINNGFNIINDVNGFKDARMWQIMQEYSNIDAVIMHSLIPNGDKNITLENNDDLINVLNIWVKYIEQQSEKYNIAKRRIIIDYGIGFGKTLEQDLCILNNINKIDNRNFRVLIGYSRKSFMQLLGANNIQQKDDMSVKINEQLEKLGVDIIRLHM